MSKGISNRVFGADIRTEIKRLNEEGVGTDVIFDYVEGRVKQSFTGTPEVQRVKKQIYVKGVQIDEEKDPDKKEKLVTQLENLNILRENCM